MRVYGKIVQTLRHEIDNPDFLHLHNSLRDIVSRKNNCLESKGQMSRPTTSNAYIQVSSLGGNCIDVDDMFVCSDDDQTVAVEPVAAPSTVATPSLPREGEPNKSSAQPLRAVSPTCTTVIVEETIPVERIYVGMHGYSGTAAKPLYVRMDRGVDRCFVLRLSDPFGVWDETEDRTDKEQQVVIEKVPFKEIAKIL
jgi:hypothetical protein